VRRWLSRPIQARQTFPQVGHVCSKPVVDALPARVLRASRLVSASFSHLSSASRAPFVIPAHRVRADNGSEWRKIGHSVVNPGSEDDRYFFSDLFGSATTLELVMCIQYNNNKKKKKKIYNAHTVKR